MAPFTAAATPTPRSQNGSAPAGVSSPTALAGKPSIQAIYDRLTARRWDSAGYEVTRTASVADVNAALAWLLNAIIERKAEIDAGVASGRDPRIIDQMRSEWMEMAERYDTATDELDALLGPKAIAAE